MAASSPDTWGSMIAWHIVELDRIRGAMGTVLHQLAPELCRALHRRGFMERLMTSGSALVALNCSEVGGYPGQSAEALRVAIEAHLTAAWGDSGFMISVVVPPDAQNQIEIAIRTRTSIN